MLVFATGTFFLALFVFLKRQDKIGRGFFVFNVFVSLWAIFHGLEISQNVNYETALLLGRLGQGTAVFVAPTWFHLTLIISNKEEKYKKWLILSYLIAILIDCFAFTPWFIPRVAPTIEFNYYHRRGPIYDVFTVLFFILIPAGFYHLIQKIRNSVREEAIQLTGFSVASGIGFIGGTFAFFPIYDIMVPQYNLLMIPIYPFVTSYFMIRHKLFDVEQIVESFQREKLAAIGLLAASINHEIRNPLYAAKSVLENFKEGISRKNPEEVTDKALSQVNRALDVITKLNRFAKPSEETKDLRQKTQANIQEAIQNVLDLVSYEFKLDKIKINNQIQNDLPSIQADQRQLEEILFNLIVNACHAMSTGKGDRQEVLPVPFSMLTLRSTIHDSRLMIEIMDTGSGISQDQMKHLFEPFHTTKGEKGTGLGLYITKQLVERNGGKISVRSKLDQGTTFILEFRTK